MKGMFKIVLITDKECEYLLSKGWKWRDYIHRTVSGANKKIRNRKLSIDAGFRKIQITVNQRNNTYKETYKQKT